MHAFPEARIYNRRLLVKLKELRIAQRLEEKREAALRRMRYIRSAGDGEYDLRLFSYISFGDNEEGFAGVDALEGNSLDVQRREGENADAVAQSLSEELNRPVIENATIGEDNLAALCVRDAALRDGVVKRAYVVTVKDGCLVVTVSNTYYAEEGDPVVEGGVAALEALLASFRLVDNEQ